MMNSPNTMIYNNESRRKPGIGIAFQAPLAVAWDSAIVKFSAKVRLMVITCERGAKDTRGTFKLITQKLTNNMKWIFHNCQQTCDEM